MQFSAGKPSSVAGLTNSGLPMAGLSSAMMTAYEMASAPKRVFRDFIPFLRQSLFALTGLSILWLRGLPAAVEKRQEIGQVGRLEMRPRDSRVAHFLAHRQSVIPHELHDRLLRLAH